MQPKDLVLNVERLEFDKPSEKEFNEIIKKAKITTPNVMKSANDHHFDPKDYKWLKIWG